MIHGLIVYENEYGDFALATDALIIPPKYFDFSLSYLDRDFINPIQSFEAPHSSNGRMYLLI